MPSIFTHMLVSEEVMKNLKGPELAGFLESQNRYFLLGSLAPDFPYYEFLAGYRGFSLGGVASAVADGLEGKVLKWFGRPPDDARGERWPYWSRRFHGARASQWVLDWLANAMPPGAPGPRGGAIAAFLLGMLSHIATDEAMHPRVEKDSGCQETYAGLERHRQIEMRLDFRLLQAFGFKAEGFVPSILLQRWLAPGSGGGLFPVELAGEWARVTASSRDRLEKSWILRWFEGFSNGAKLVGHALSPIRQAQKDLKAGDTGELDAILEAGTYLDVLFPRAVSQAALGVGMAWESMMRREELYARA